MCEVLPYGDGEDRRLGRSHRRLSRRPTAIDVVHDQAKAKREVSAQVWHGTVILLSRLGGLQHVIQSKSVNDNTATADTYRQARCSCTPCKKQ